MGERKAEIPFYYNLEGENLSGGWREATFDLNKVKEIRVEKWRVDYKRYAGEKDRFSESEEEFVALLDEAGITIGYIRPEVWQKITKSK